MVYFICGISDTCNLVKIGHANCPQQRLKMLQTGSPIPLGLVMTEDGGITREKQLHTYFRESRCFGEWFSPSTKLIDYVMKSACHLLPDLASDIACDPIRLEAVANVLGWTIDDVLDELERVTLETQLLISP
jgi:hypothetical protein